MQTLGWRLQNTFDDTLPAPTFWLHGDQNNPGYQLDYIGVSNHLQLELWSPHDELLASDHRPFAARVTVNKLQKTTYKASMIGWLPDSAEHYNTALITLLCGNDHSVDVANVDQMDISLERINQCIPEAAKMVPHTTKAQRTKALLKKPEQLRAL